MADCIECKCPTHWHSYGTGHCYWCDKICKTEIRPEQDTSPIFTTPQRKCGKCGHTQKNHKLTANDNMPCNVAHCACSNFAV